MASTWSELGIRLMATGENSNAWGGQTNDNWNRLEDAADGFATVAVSGATTLTFTAQPTSYADENGRNKVLLFTGTAGGTQAITFPNIEKTYHVLNDSNSTLTLTTGTGAATVSLAAGKDKIIYNDGSDEIHDALANLAITTLTASGIIKTDDTTNATSTTDGSLQTDGGLSVALDAVIGDDLFMKSDSSVIHFGADSDVTLTHVADTGLIIRAEGTADTLSIVSGDDGTAAGPSLELRRDSASPADNDGIGAVVWTGRNDNSQDYQAAIIKSQASDVSDGSEDSFLYFRTMHAGSETEHMAFLTTETVFNDASNDIDFRVESNGNANAIFVNGGTDQVTIGAGGVSSSIAGIPFYLADTSIYTHDVSGTDDTAQQNAAYGIEALDAITTGDANTAIGRGSSSGITTGSRNVALGRSSLDSPDTENDNLAIGYNALAGTIAGGEFNVAIGNYALDALTSGDRNTSVGYGSGTDLTTAVDLAALGYNAGANVTEGTHNTFLGSEAGLSVTTGSRNTIIGVAGWNFDTENDNLGIGYNALGGAINGGEDNIAIGNGALEALTSADGTIAIGFEAGHAVTTDGGGSIFIGKAAGHDITTGHSNIMIGEFAGDGFDAETHNVAIGRGAFGGAVNGGEFNVCMGNSALMVLTSGDSCTSIGDESGKANTTGYNNTFIGQRAGAGVTEGFANTLIGANAAHGNSVTLTTGDQNTLVGRNIQTTDANSNTANGLGYFLSCEGGYTTLGQSGDDIRAAHGNTSWATVSDKRFKKNIETSDAGLAVINDLRPVTYNWKTRGEIPEWSSWYEEGSDEQYRNSKLNHGFVAQEVKAVIDSHSELKDGFSMWYEREDGQQEVGETAIVPILVKAVQELSATVTTLQQEINILKGE